MEGDAYTIYRANQYRYVDEGPANGEVPIVLLHGMLGHVDNWGATISALSARQYRVLVPLLPIYDLPVKETSVSRLASYVAGFLHQVGLRSVVVAGNSLGGHVATLFALDHPEMTRALVLTGSSGIYEVEMGTSTLRRKDRDDIRRRAAMTFYSDKHVTEELIDEVVAIVNDRAKAIRLIRLARAVQAETITKRLSSINVPALLIWGRNDVITPPDVAHEFERLLPEAHLHFLDECGHAPMMEHPDDFNRVLIEFLERRILPEESRQMA